ncbi:MAG: TolC family protein [Treponema sp.]|nr:TolC family protein [Treponema sp.]
MIQKTISFIILLSSPLAIFPLSLENLTNLALENNSEIKAAESAYEKAVLSSKTLDGVYVPSISVSSSTKLPDEYEWNSTPDSFSSTITYSQPIPGGASLSATANYSFNAMTIAEERMMSQSPNISLSLTQSLLPYWAQGKLRNPERLSMNQQKRYYYYQLLHVKKNIIINLIENYFYTITSKNEITIQENTIKIFEEQIESLKELAKSGNISQSKILETENAKWSAQQTLMSAQTSYANYLQNLKTICGKDFYNESLNFYETDDFGNQIYNILCRIIDIDTDPLELSYKLKLEIIKNARILEKQNFAPNISVSIEPDWSLEIKKQSEWQKTLKNMGAPDSWNTSIGINISPLLSGLARQNNKKFRLDYEEAENAYNSYLEQKSFLKQKYKALSNYYLKQKAMVSELYDSGQKELDDYSYQYKMNVISKLDFDSIRVRVENCRLTKENIDLYFIMYDFLEKMY